MEPRRGSQEASPGGRGPASGDAAAGGSAGEPPLASLAAEQPWESGRYPEEQEDGLQPSCLEFTTLEQGLRWASALLQGGA